MTKQSLSFLGLLRKGGNLVIGKAVDGIIPKASLIILADDAGEAEKKAILDKASYYHKTVIGDVDKATLGHALGYPSLSCVALMQAKAAKKILDDELRKKGATL